jgi:hypothetical protein
MHDMSKVNTFEARSYTNEFGQLIEPGDPVIYAGTAYQSTNHTRAVFEGVYVNSRGSVEAVRVGNVPHQRWIWNKETGKGHHEDRVRKAVLPLRRVFKLA